MSVRHVWRSWTGRGSWTTWCRRPMRGEAIATKRDHLETATCLDCLRSLRRTALYEAKEWAAIAEAAVDRVEHVQRERRR